MTYYLIETSTAERQMQSKANDKNVSVLKNLTQQGREGNIIVVWFSRQGL